MLRREQTSRQEIPEQWRRRLSRSRAIERILVKEYDSAHTQLAETTKMHLSDPVKDAIERCIQASQRLRKFLANGEIPPDVVEKLNQRPNESVQA